LVEEYWYNGLGNRIAWKYDTDVDNDVDGSDKKFHFVYDERWRVVATYRDTDSDPKEQFIYHCAGADGLGGSSYIDTIVLRDKDASTNWVTAAADAFDRRDYYCQNWRADVVALITDGGRLAEWVKYSAYGVPYGIPQSDTNGDGVVNSADNTNISNWWGTTKPTGDFNLDGTIDINDLVNQITHTGDTLGRGKLSKAGGTGPSANRHGYAGYEFDAVAAYSLWHVRNRMLNSDLGRWMTRDPLGYVDGANLLMFVNNDPMTSLDPTGENIAQPLPSASSSRRSSSCDGSPCDAWATYLPGTGLSLASTLPVVGPSCCGTGLTISPTGTTIVDPLTPGLGAQAHQLALSSCTGPIVPLRTCADTACLCRPDGTSTTNAGLCSGTATLNWTCSQPSAWGIVTIKSIPVGLSYTPGFIATCSQSITFGGTYTTVISHGTCQPILSILQ
jgi:RHS repeat-associated protein